MNATTLNISAHAIKTLAVRGNTAARQEIVLPPGTTRNGLILQPEVMGGQLKSLVKSGKLSKDRIICAVNGLPFSYRFLTLPKLAPSAFNEAVLRTAKEEMSISPDEMYLSWQAFPAENNEWQVLVTGITRHPVDNLIKTLSEAGISPWLLDLPHLALARLSPHKDAVILDVERDCSNIVILVGGVPRGMHMVPALASGASMQDQVAQVADKLSKMIDFYNGGHPAQPVKEPANILVTGEILDDEKAMDYLQSQIGSTVKSLTTTNQALSGLPLHQYAVNVGSGLINAELEKDTGKNAVPCRYFNLERIAREHRPKTDIRKTLKKVLVPAMLVVGVGLLATSFLSYVRIKGDLSELQADLDRVNTGLALRQEASSEAGRIESAINEVASMIKNIKAGQLEMFSSSDYVDEISSIVACMPVGLTFTALEINSEEISLFGNSYEASPVVLFADELETTGDFSGAVINWIEKPHDTGTGERVISFKIDISRAKN